MDDILKRRLDEYFEGNRGFGLLFWGYLPRLIEAT
jgi:hypothetical protein